MGRKRSWNITSEAPSPRPFVPPPWFLVPHLPLPMRCPKCFPQRQVGVSHPATLFLPLLTDWMLMRVGTASSSSLRSQQLSAQERLRKALWIEALSSHKISPRERSTEEPLSFWGAGLQLLVLFRISLPLESGGGYRPESATGFSFGKAKSYTLKMIISFWSIHRAMFRGAIAKTQLHLSCPALGKVKGRAAHSLPKERKAELEETLRE